MRLRSVELLITQPDEAAEFLERVWGLAPAGTQGGTRYFRGTADHSYLVSIRAADAPALSTITHSGSPEEIGALRERVRRSGAPCRTFDSLDEPGGGPGFVVQGPEAQAHRFVTESAVAPLPASRDQPIQLTHVVLNSRDVAASERFAVATLAFVVSDRTRMMSFVRCNRKHHCVAYAHADVASLHHIAFEMQDIDAVMRGFGRMRDAGHASVWGPGRHGPGNNVFGYFIAPFGAVIEYTAEVSEVDENTRVGGPEDWAWPPGRIDHWGLSEKDTARTEPAERRYRFAPEFF